MNDSILKIKGIGQKKYQEFLKLGVKTLEDLMHFYPRSYQDRTKIKHLSNCIDQEYTGVIVKVIGEAKNTRIKGRRLVITKVPIEDNGTIGEAIWYNKPFIKNLLQVEKKYYLYGKLKRKFNRIQIETPDYKPVDQQSFEELGILPIYSGTSHLKQKEIRKYIRLILDEFNGEIEEYLSINFRKKYKLCEINFALENIHYPKTYEHYEIAKKRLIFDEFFFIQMALLLIKKQNKQQVDGIIFRSSSVLENFIGQLPFQLTDAQNRVIQEIREDLNSGKIMNRLIQGDVGSGKTIIATIALLMTYLNGYQGAMMAPTEILANQHYESLSNLYKSFDIKIALLTGNMKTEEKRNVLQQISEGQVNIVIGTHALIQENVNFHKLGLVVTDEQHRFGVRQRATLSNKGENPHVMVMTATPIPRTLSFILYGDLDISIIDQLPPGRKKIKTYQISSEMEDRLYQFIRQQVKSGRQAYIVCPLVEESENIQAQSVLNLAKNLKKQYFHKENVAFIHGKMKNIEKENIMRDFKDRNIDILISTTIIEVGMNVPNANIMVIQNAERFGLAQLHQLRGRVGRGSHQSYCFLITNNKSAITRERMQTMTRTNDGFTIAERDLLIRGPGDFFGVRQHGLPELKIANLFRDMEILKLAQKACKEVMELEEFHSIQEYISNKFDKKLDEVSFN